MSSISSRHAGVVLLSLLLMLALNACGGGGVIPINQEPTISPRGQTPTPTPTPKPGSAFTYAFARDGQVWVAQAGKSAQQLSHLPTERGNSISALAWSPDNKHLAFELDGAGNPVDYVIDTSSGAFSALNVPSTTAVAQLGWADNKTVVAAKRVGSKTQFWKVDITNNTSSQITEVDGSPQMKVRGQSVYYNLLDTNTNQMMLHRYDINLASEGTPIAITAAGSSTLKVNWDIAPDGSHVLMGFRMATEDASWENGFWYINFNDATDRVPVFTNEEIPFSSFKDSDTVTLSFSPDGETALLVTNGTVGPATEGIDDTNFRTYSPHVSIGSPAGISWAPNSASFALNSTGSASRATIYSVGSESAGSTFVDKANLLQWAPKS